MADPISSVSGLASGIQWREMITQLVALDTSRQVLPLQTRVATNTSRLQAWDSYRAQIATFSALAAKLRDGAAFETFQASATNSATTNRALVGVSAGAGAQGGSYRVGVEQLAQAHKVSGAVLPSATTALGLAGAFSVNGATITVTAADTLTSVRDKLNAVASGTDGSRVAATILSTSTGQQRLVLTAQDAGARGIELVDDGSGLLQQLGFVDGTRVLNQTSDGGTQSGHFGSATMAVAAQLGLTAPGATTIRVGGVAIAVDLAVDSLETIAAKVSAAGGTAEVVSDVRDGRASARLVVGGLVSVEGTDAAASQQAIDLLGFMRGGRAGVAQTLTSDVALTDGMGGAATGATLLTALGNGATGAGVTAGDVITLSGRRGDGTAFQLQYAVTGTDTVDDLLQAINDPTTGLGGGRAIQASLDATGRLVFTDGVAGESQLAVAMRSDNAGGGTLNFGRQLVTTTGRARELAAGQDAVFTIDGTRLTRSSNVVSDAISGTTLTLLAAEVGSVVDVRVAADHGAALKAVQDLVKGYNDLSAYVTKARATNGPLFGDSTFRQSFTAFKATFFSAIGGLSADSTLTRASSVGLALDRHGVLTLDASAFTAALESSPTAVRALFEQAVTPTDPEVAYVSGGANATEGRYAVVITQAATVSRTTGVGFGGTYTDADGGDSMQITDSVTGKTVSVALANGDSVETIAAKLNAAFAADTVSMTARVSGGQLELAQNRHGSAAHFTVAYTGGGADGTAQLGLAAGQYQNGVDVAGTINGVAATGSGQLLTGAAGTAVDGLVLRYTGTAARAAGEIGFVRGLGGLLTRQADRITDTVAGLVVRQRESIEASTAALDRRIADAEARIERRRMAMVLQYNRMEEMLGRLQSQGSWLASQVNALPTWNTAP